MSLTNISRIGFYWGLLGYSGRYWLLENAVLQGYGGIPREGEGSQGKYGASAKSQQLQDIPLQHILLGEIVPVNLLVQCSLRHQYSFCLKNAVIGNTVHLRKRYILASIQTNTYTDSTSCYGYQSFSTRNSGN
jgi:hypothetical protein